MCMSHVLLVAHQITNLCRSYVVISNLICSIEDCWVFIHLLIFDTDARLENSAIKEAKIENLFDLM